MPTIERKETHGCTKKFHIVIEPERLDDQIQATVKEVKKDVQIPGFRKGRAPEIMIVKRFGPTIRQEAIKELIPKVLTELFESEGVKPVNDPDISDLSINENAPITFNVSIEEAPEVDIAGVKGLQVTRHIFTMTDAIVDSEIERIRHMYARQEEAARELRKGDILVANLQKLDASGVPIIGEKIENHVIPLDGQSTPSPEFDEQVVGLKVGDRKTIRFTYDETINNPDLVGTTESYDVEVLKVMENIVPDLDEEFLKKLGNFASVDELKKLTRERLQHQYDSASKRRLHKDIIEAFIRQEPFEVPNSMVERIIKSEIDRMRRANRGERIDESEMRIQLRPEAVRAVQTFIILNAVKKAENIEVTKEEADARIEAVAALSGYDAKEYRRFLIKEGRLDEFKDEIASDKAYDWMVGVADITDEEVKDNEGGQTSNIVAP